MGDEDGNVPDMGNIYEYGLSFDYVAPDTFNEQPRGYWRYQLSWGGPSDEFQFYGEQIQEFEVRIDQLEYWFLDWFDGARALPFGDDYDFIHEIFQNLFVDSGIAAHVRNEALEDWTP